MEDEFIPYAEALALKELGFDKKCFGCYEKDIEYLIINYTNTPLTKEQKKRPFFIYGYQ